MYRVVKHEDDEGEDFVSEDYYDDWELILADFQARQYLDDVYEKDYSVHWEVYDAETNELVEEL